MTFVILFKHSFCGCLVVNLVCLHYGRPSQSISSVVFAFTLLKKKKTPMKNLFPNCGTESWPCFPRTRELNQLPWCNYKKMRRNYHDEIVCTMVCKFIWIAFTKKSNTSKTIPLRFSSLIFVRDLSRGRHFERALLKLIAHFQLED